MGNYFKLLAACGIAVLFLSVACNGYFVWKNVQLHRTADEKGSRLQRIETSSREWQGFFQELLAYSQRQPQIDPVLQKYGLKPPAGTSQPQP